MEIVDDRRMKMSEDVLWRQGALDSDAEITVGRTGSAHEPALIRSHFFTTDSTTISCSRKTVATPALAEGRRHDTGERSELHPFDGNAELSTPRSRPASSSTLHEHRH